MCGRYYVEPDIDYEADALVAEALARLFEGEGAVKTGEVFPNDRAAVIARSRSLEPSAFAMRWGYRRASGGLVINARSETAASGALFRESAEKRRCAVFASRYFEWQKTEDGQKKYSFGLPKGEGLYLAGLYRLEADAPRFVVLTRAAAQGVAEIHARMPIVLRERSVARWLDAANDYGELLALAETELEFKAV